MLDEFDPDLILAPNYTRRDLEKVITGHENAPPESRVLPAGSGCAQCLSIRDNHSQYAHIWCAMKWCALECERAPHKMVRH